MSYILNYSKRFYIFILQLQFKILYISKASAVYDSHDIEQATPIWISIMYTCCNF